MKRPGEDIWTSSPYLIIVYGLGLAIEEEQNHSSLLNSRLPVIADP